MWFIAVPSRFRFILQLPRSTQCLSRPRSSSRLLDLALLMRLYLTSLGFVTERWLDMTRLKFVTAPALLHPLLVPTPLPPPPGGVSQSPPESSQLVFVMITVVIVVLMIFVVVVVVLWLSLASSELSDEMHFSVRFLNLSRFSVTASA
uniref:(northern house mosquito) hypothetical protein n=1 Tax=Culex pipiens TaxID=7175 RepID=A0A8D8KLL2_CULPI